MSVHEYICFIWVPCLMGLDVCFIQASSLISSILSLNPNDILIPFLHSVKHIDRHNVPVDRMVQAVIKKTLQSRHSC